MYVTIGPMTRALLLIGLGCLPFDAAAAEPIAPLPRIVVYDKGKAALGKALFSEVELSKDRSVACVSCHDFTRGGADLRPVSIGVEGIRGNIQSPTVYNARFSFKQFWNGRAQTLGEQAEGPTHSPEEMGMDAAQVEQRLNAMPRYRRWFQRVFDTFRIRYSHVVEAIVEFEMALVTPDAPIDRFLRGEAPLTPVQMEGYKRFKSLGCVTCHNGINIGGNSFQKIGLFFPYNYDPRYPDRFAVTGRQGYKNVFKVPTLRNIALTAPYLHDASAATLEEAIRKMGHHNLGTELGDDDVRYLVAFLHTLTGQPPKVLDE